MSYVELEINPATGRPFGEAWFDQARGRENATFPHDPWYTPAELAPHYVGSGLKQLWGEQPKFAMHTFDPNAAHLTPDPAAQMLMALRLNHDGAANQIPPERSYGQTIGDEIRANRDAAWSDAQKEALAIAQRRAAFDSARYGIDRPEAYRQIQQNVMAVETPGLGINPFIANLEATAPAHAIGFGNVLGGSHTDNTPSGARASQAGVANSINEFVGGLNLDHIGANLAAIAGSGLAKGRSHGALRRAYAASYNAIPQSALMGDEFATYTTPAAGSGESYRGRIT